MVTVGTKVDAELKAKLIGQAANEGKTVNQLLGILIKDYLHSKNPAPEGTLENPRTDLELTPHPESKPKESPKPKKEPYTCEKCGFVLEKHPQFCPNCGIELDWSSAGGSD